MILPPPTCQAPTGAPISFDVPMLGSAVARAEDFLTTGYHHWCQRLGEAPRWHRKQWEHCYIAQVLYERGFLAPNKRGLGFGVGGEQLAALFVAHGARVVATDAPPEAVGPWGETWKGNLAALNAKGICDATVFSERASYRSVDMRDIPADLHGGFDFTWSACALEHLGSVEAGFDFIVQQGRCLTQGGVGVHTTEMRLFSDDSVEMPGVVVYGARDLERLALRLKDDGCRMAVLRRGLGKHPASRFLGLPTDRGDIPHLLVMIGSVPATSVGLVVIREKP